MKAEVFSITIDVLQQRRGNPLSDKSRKWRELDGICHALFPSVLVHVDSFR